MRVLKTIHLSEYQKKVLSIVKAAPTPQVAFEELKKQPPEEQRNINGARDMMQKLGLLEVGQHDISVTDEGEQVMKDEYLIDEMGELTDEAQKYLQDASGNQDAEMQEPQQGMGDEMGGEQGVDDLEGMDELDDDMSMEDIEKSFEGLELFKLIHDQSKFLKN